MLHEIKSTVEDSQPSIMKAFGCVLLMLLELRLCCALSPLGLEYILQAIEHLARLHTGVFSCVFYDVAPSYPFDNILSDLLKSARLEHVVKYEISGMFNTDLEKLPWNPSLVIVHPGQDLEYFKRHDTRRNMADVMELFNPVTNVLVFVNQFDRHFIKFADGVFQWCKFAYTAYFDSNTIYARLCSDVLCLNVVNLPPQRLFSYNRLLMKGRNITYVINKNNMKYSHNRKWVKEVARYLRARAVESPLKCKGSGIPFQNCLEEYAKTPNSVEIALYDVVTMKYFTRKFQLLSTSIPTFIKFAVPRDRALNSFELMLLPFSGEVWALLLVILFSVETVRNIFPNLFKNDPILLVVCGYERHDLHQAGRWEKAVLLPLIVLMFFLSNAFETKIISLMVRKPSIQQIKTLDDLFHSELRFHVDLENLPGYAENPITGRLAVQGKVPNPTDKIQGVAVAWMSDSIDVLHDMSFDHERMQQFYVILEGEYFNCIEMYGSTIRFPLLEVFRFVHLAWIEAGIMIHWNKKYKYAVRYVYNGIRPKFDIDDKTELEFDDLQIAWLIVASGLAVSFVGFVGEHIKNRLSTHRILKDVKLCKFIK